MMNVDVRIDRDDLKTCKDAKVQQDESYLSSGDLSALNRSSNV